MKLLLLIYKTLKKSQLIIASIIILFFILAFTYIFISQPQKSAVSLSKQPDSKETLYRDLLLSQLTPYINEAIKKYYGQLKSYDLYNAKVLNIKRSGEGSSCFEITVQVVTYEGFHNPPYGIDTITFRQDQSGIYLTSFKHEVVISYSRLVLDNLYPLIPIETNMITISGIIILTSKV